MLKGETEEKYTNNFSVQTHWQGEEREQEVGDNLSVCVLKLKLVESSTNSFSVLNCYLGLA